jgi:hypothetical protein
MSQEAAVTVTPPRVGYLQKEVPVYAILISFPALTVPLCLLAVLDPELIKRYFVAPIYMWSLGMTHFVITLTIYLQSSNLRHFNSSWRNRALYFLVPAGIFVSFYLYPVFGIAFLFPGLDLLLRNGIRFFDFHHVTRQSYGVLQLFKGRSRGPFPLWMKKTESFFFWSLTVALLLTFWSGGKVDTEEPLLVAFLAVPGVLFLVMLAGFVLTWRRTPNRRALAAPFIYLLLQSGSTVMGVYSTALWTFALAMHYVEYHVLMIPRCFDSPLDPTSKVDRFCGRLRRSKVVFYAVLLGVAGGVAYLNWGAMGAVLLRSQAEGSGPYVALIAVFDGLFIFHYFVESLIWKFSDPFYRKSLAPLYFGQKAAQPVVPGPDSVDARVVVTAK